jgi:SAM-dependent methyltransferase
VTAAVLAAANPQPGDLVVDLGCRSGQLSIPLAGQGALVLAFDGNLGLIEQLREQARELAVPDIEALPIPLTRVCLPDASVDLVVTSYALHHLRNSDKDRLVTAAYQWLRPGGTLIVADMMFGRGRTSADRAIIRSKVRVLARRGIGGWWRIAKNAYRFLLRIRERPVSIGTWTAMLGRAGFTGITAASVINEAGLVSGRRPATANVPAPRQGEPELARTGG